MKSKLVIVAAVVFPLAGCISIATHEEQMRRCRTVGQRADDLQKQVGDLQNQIKDLQDQLAQKTAEGEEMQKSIAEMKSANDELQDKLKNEIAQGEVALREAKGRLTITLGDKVLFRSGQWELQPRGRTVVAQVAQVLKTVDDKLFQVEGNTDNVPVSGSLKQRFASNWDLSSARASAVVRALEKNGVNSDRLVLTAYGDKRPVGDNRTPEGRRLNRRVEISLLPLPPEKN